MTHQHTRTPYLDRLRKLYRTKYSVLPIATEGKAYSLPPSCQVSAIKPECQEWLLRIKAPTVLNLELLPSGLQRTFTRLLEKHMATEQLSPFGIYTCRTFA